MLTFLLLQGMPQCTYLISNPLVPLYPEFHWDTLRKEIAGSQRTCTHNLAGGIAKAISQLYSRPRTSSHFRSIVRLHNFGQLEAVKCHCILFLICTSLNTCEIEHISCSVNCLFISFAHFHNVLFLLICKHPFYVFYMYCWSSRLQIPFSSIWLAFFLHLCHLSCIEDFNINVIHFLFFT